MPIVVAGLAFVTFTTLLILGQIGEASYCFLVASSALLGLVLHGFGRLQELDLKNLRLVLRDIEQAKKELFVREEKLKAIVVPLVQIVAFTGASEGRVGDRESFKLKREWYRRKVDALASALELAPIEAAEMQKYMNKYAEIDSTMGDRDILQTTDPDYHDVKARREKLAAELLEMLKVDLSK